MLRIISLFLLTTLALCQKAEPELKWQTYTSRGLFDHRTGLTFYIVSKTKKVMNNGEFFAGIGTMFAINSIATGMKFHIDKSSRFYDNMYALAGMRVMAFSHRDLTLENARFVPTVALGIEKKLWDKSYINIGLFTSIEYYGDERGTSALTFPSISYITRW